MFSCFFLRILPHVPLNTSALYLQKIGLWLCKVFSTPSVKKRTEYKYISGFFFSFENHVSFIFLTHMHNSII